MKSCISLQNLPIFSFMKKSHPSTSDQILDSIADGVFTVDADWNVTSFNKAAEKITGTSRDDALGRKCWEVFHADVCERECLLKKTLKTKKQAIDKTVHIVNRDGTVVPISISTAILKDEKGNVTGGVETFRDISEVEELRKEVSGKYRHHDIITADHRMLGMIELLPVVAVTDSPVLLLGESGTGKELFAKAIHGLSGRGRKPFVAVNCGALPENLLESELFGYRRGAFTDAKTDKPGRFDRAAGGTLFLDEIGELPRTLQVKLLRVLQERQFEPLGATESVPFTARVIAATNRDLQRMAADGSFRQDLYYRINVVPFTLPPLRDRPGDVPILVDHFVRHFNILMKKEIRSVAPDAMELLMEYTFPGNIRELENIVHHAFVVCQGAVIEKRHLPQLQVRDEGRRTRPATVKGTFEEYDRKTVEEALIAHRFKRADAARALGINPATLWRKMKKYGLIP